MTWTLSNSLLGLVKSLKAERIDICSVFHTLGIPVSEVARAEEALTSGFGLTSHVLAEQWHLRV